MEVSEKWDALLAAGMGEEALGLVVNINGYSDQTLDDVLYARFGTHDWEDIC